MKKLPKTPFKEIALCMSGGGYRAASFHLGAMNYLNRIQYFETPLLENVKAISTVSGGTITGVVYALYKERGKTFEEVYEILISQLKERDLVKEGLSKLKINGKWNNNFKRKNLINALAEIYIEKFTDNAVFKELLGKNLKSHLDLVVFNATEFDNGINFRFQNKGVLGNRYFNIPKRLKEEIKLGDVIAASSCFPGGFEPIGFPGDFRHDNAANLIQSVGTDFKEEIGLMDGGIYDNQGIDAIRLSEQRNKKLYDLIIISDVSSPDMHGFRFNEKQTQDGFRKLNINKFIISIKKYNSLANWFLVIIIVLGIAGSIISGFKNNLGTGIGLSVMGFGIIGMIIFNFIRKKFLNITNNVGSYIKGLIPEFFYKHLSALNLTDYTIGTYEPLMVDRVKSLLLLIQDVFLKQIRRLNYATIYDSDDYAFRRISNLSKELTEENFEARTKRFQSLENCPPQLQKPYKKLISVNLRKTISEAASFGTNLWFTEEDDLNKTLEKLVVSGQFNMCFNLLVYIFEIKGNKDFEKYSDILKNEFGKIEKELLSDWNKFNENPNFMLYSKF